MAGGSAPFSGVRSTHQGGRPVYMDPNSGSKELTLCPRIGEVDGEEGEIVML